MVKIPWHKKPWEKVACNYTLQEYRPGAGWNTITEPAGEPPTVDECREHFKPGHHYRLIARALEDGENVKGGTYVGVLWSKYEPLPGGVMPVTPKVEKPPKPKDAVEVMDEYVGEVRRVLEPIRDIATALNELRDSLFPEGMSGSGGAPSREAASDGYGGFPPPEFEGKIPVIMHPYVVHTIAEEIKGVIEYGATRLEGILGKGPMPGAPSAEEEEELMLPSISKFAKPPPPTAEALEEPKTLEEKEMEERVEEEEAIEEEEIEEEEKTVPSLIGEKPCANCGKVVPLLPSGLCELCAKKLGKLAEEHERELQEEREAEVEEEEEASE